ncbi:hypothetical protein [Caldivirga sp.]|uniref:hypothetical protein n=1 Tax=Caldivirga sp. TaxID=2080243 RepID=UPI003D0C8F1F
MPINERKLAIVSGIVLGEDSETGINVRLSELRQVLSRRINNPDAVIGKLTEEGVFKMERVGGGFRVIIQYTPEVKGIYGNVVESIITFDDFIKELNNAIMKHANPATGYADLGVVMKYVCSRLGIGELDFDQLFLKAIRINGRKYVLSYGGSHRVKVGSGYYGLVKVIP